MSPSEPTTGFLRELIGLNDEKHTAGHRRLRTDLTEGLNTVTDNLDRLVLAQARDHDMLVAQKATRERRKELTGYKAIIVAASVAGVFQLMIAVMNLIARAR